jgi:hypothetical protein
MMMMMMKLMIMVMTVMIEEANIMYNNNFIHELSSLHGLNNPQYISLYAYE